MIYSTVICGYLLNALYQCVTGHHAGHLHPHHFPPSLTHSS